MSYTPQQHRANKKLAECLAIANQHFSREFPHPIITFKLRGKAAGKAYLQLNEIKLNHVLFSENEDAFINEVVPHELAHLITHQVFGRVRPHGNEWKYVMEKVFNVPARTTHSFEIA